MKKYYQLFTVLLAFNFVLKAQVPGANFSVSPNPVCSGTNNSVQITDHSSGSPTSWSYTVLAGGPGGQQVVLSTQNPTITPNFPGIYTITLIASNSSGASAPISQTVAVLPSPNVNITPLSPTTCVGGNPVSLTVISGGGPGGAGTFTYLWSTSSTASLITVNPGVTTSYSCTITSTNGCSVQRTATVFIGTPSITIIGVPASICPGVSTTLNATGTAPGPFTYTWSNAATTKTTSTAVAGVYNVTVTNGNACTAVESYTLGTSSTLSLTAIANPSILCAGNTATVRVIGAANYTWNTGATSANTTVNPVTTTVYTVQGQIGTCTGTTVLTLSVNVTPTLQITATSTSLCAGNSATLMAGGANTYTWLPSTLSESMTISPAATANYTVRGNNPGCQNRTATISILVAQNPVITLVTNTNVTCAGEVVALAASGANTYTWSNSATGAVQLVSPTVTSTYSVIGFDLNNCYGTASITQSVNACTGIYENTFSEGLPEMFPNPANDQINFKSAADNVKISIIDNCGKVVKYLELKDSEQYSLNISDLANGIYFVHVNASGNDQIKKLVVLK